MQYSFRRSHPSGSVPMRAGYQKFCSSCGPPRKVRRPPTGLILDPELRDKLRHFRPFEDPRLPLQTVICEKVVQKTESDQTEQMGVNVGRRLNSLRS
jgi:hypothetical protein